MVSVKRMTQLGGIVNNCRKELRPTVLIDLVDDAAAPQPHAPGIDRTGLAATGHGVIETGCGDVWTLALQGQRWVCGNTA